MRIVLTILFLIAFKCDAQIIRANPFHTNRAVAVVTDTLLLDSFPAIVGYSLRKLRTNYTGNCIKVRRSSDNTTQDIGFVNNYLDTASMKTFVGNNNAFIDTWYSQGDSARNFTQSTQANQPRIISSGVIDRSGSDIGLYFDGSRFMDVASSTSFFSFLHKTGQKALFLVCQAGIVSNPNTFYSFISNAISSSNSGILLAYEDRSSVPRNNASFSAVYRGQTGTYVSEHSPENIFTPNQQNLYTNLLDNANATAANRNIVYINTTEGKTNTFTGTPSTGNASQNIRIGRLANSTNFPLTGYMQEVIIYDADKSSDRTKIENNINRNWLIY